MIFIYVTTSSEQEAKKISKLLLEKKLIACANIFPISSVYKWEGKIVDEKEVVIILKTVKKNYEKIKKAINEVHSYNTTCITQVDVKPNKEYSDWLMKQF